MANRFDKHIQTTKIDNSKIVDLFSKASKATIGDAFKGINNAIDNLTTTKEEKGILDIKFQQLQTEINKLESQNASIFVSGWRPFIGWVCGVSLGFNFIIRPIFNYILMVFYPHIAIMESLDIGVLTTLVTGMLGFGALRTYEKQKNKARD